MGPRAAMFDMDRTLLRVDSSMSWIRFLRRRGELSKRFVAKSLWWSVQYKLALLDIDSMADRVAMRLEGTYESEMIEKSALWHSRDLERQVAPKALEAIAAHRERGDVVVLLTGGGPYAARNVARTVGIEHVLCTELEVEDGRFTGRLSQRCFGSHKVTVAERWADEHGIDLDEAVFYSDSYNDLPMLSRIGQPIAVNADPRLRRHAERHGWPTETWAD
jgi:HAD superfamily hydrolase (TIGR01490 family)